MLVYRSDGDEPRRRGARAQDLMRWLLQWLLGDADRRAIESDLAELYEVRRQQDGDRAAERWLRRQLATYPLHLLRERVRTTLGPEAGVGGLMSGLLSDLRHSAQPRAGARSRGDDCPHRRTRPWHDGGDRHDD